MTELLPKHHYIPVLYLKQWAVNGRFTEFSRPDGRNRVEPRGTGPRGTGYKRGLYRIMTDGLPEDLAERVERRFMQTVDNLAKDALDIVLANAHHKWTLKTRSAWSRFVNGIIFRAPERVEAARKYLEDFWLDEYDRHEAEYNAGKAKDDPDFLDYVIDSIGRGTLEFTINQIDNMNIGRLLNSMQWHTADVSMVGRPLFTSDRPVIYSNGLAYANSHLVLPVSPTRLFVATNSDATARLLLNDMPRRELVKVCNKYVVRRARKYAWNRDDSEVGFVRKHLSGDAHLDDLYWSPKPLRDAQANRPSSSA